MAGIEDGEMVLASAISNVIGVTEEGVMDCENETSKRVRANHARIRELLLNKDLESSYVDSFCMRLQEIVEGI